MEKEPENSNTIKESEPSGFTGLKEKVIGKITGTTDITLDESDVYLSESIMMSNNIKMILMGLLALIGFIILVYAIFTASVTVESAQVATSIFITSFIVAIIGAFTLFGVVVVSVENIVLGINHPREIGDKEKVVGMVTKRGFDLYLKRMEKDERYPFKYGSSHYQAAKNEQGDLELFELE